ncbi:MAG: hypothetical protein IPJ88_08020 [Myxococcales bacterium]|nr:MAG: hypothetical protein IPJ88_08020 [Myxococcales bacterium]
MFQLWEFWAARQGLASFYARFELLPSAARIGLTVLAMVIPFLLYAYTGLLLAIRGEGLAPSQYGSVGLRRLQRIAGFVVIVFCSVHLWQFWLSNLGKADLASAVFFALYAEAGKPIYIVLYVLGITAVCFQWAQGIVAWGVLRGWVSNDAVRRRWRTVSGAVALCMWLVGIEVFSFFATGDYLSKDLVNRTQAVFESTSHLTGGK